MKQFLCISIVVTILCFEACNTEQAKTVSATDDTTVTYRPLYHFTTDSNWINDPNGLVYANGQYHLFAQYNPFGAKWGHMSWAHAVSTDLFSWKEMPVAIAEEIGADSVANMIFSGSAVVDSFNTSGFGKDGQIPMVAIYTSHKDKGGKGIGQSESIAYSLDEGITWKKYEGNPVLDIHITDFRDPKVFWYAPEKKWVMAVVKSLEYKVQFYASANLKEWKLMSEFGGIGNTKGIWECPDLFQLRIEGSNEKKWVLALSAGHQQKDYVAMQYFVGDFDGKKFTADKLQYPLYLDYGKDYYAGIVYNNIPAADGRSIMIGWASSWIYARDIPTGNVWRGIYAVPRSLTLRNTANGLRLVQMPVAELDKHEQNLYAVSAIELNNTSKNLDSAKGTSLDISFTLEAETVAGINVFKTGTEETTITYNRNAKTITLDRTRSGDTSFNKAFAGIETIQLDAVEEKIKLRILIDKSLVEVFVNDGLYAITDLVFPKQNNGGIELFSKNGKAVFTDVIIKQVKKTLH